MFYDAYGPVCDSMAVEHAGPIYRGAKDNDQLATAGMTQFGIATSEVNICPQPFSAMQVNPDGKVVPCYSIEYPCFVGDANKESLFDIWNGEKLKEFRLKMLDGRIGASANCAVCKIICHRMYPEDSLDNATERLKGVFG
mgnify:CR=1 FL=1